MKINLTIFINLVITLVLSTGLIACGGSGKSVADPNPFKIKVNTSIVSSISTSDVQFKIPTFGAGYSYEVDCDSDGVLEATGETGDYICNYDETGPGEYIISISGSFPQFYLDFRGDVGKVTELMQWGTGQWRSMKNMFGGASKMVSSATDTPDISLVTDMSRMFTSTKFNQNIGDWDVSNVESMSYMFSNSSFNQNIGKWDVSSVNDMSFMFSNVTLSTSNYSDLLEGWSALNLQNNVIFDAGDSRFSDEVSENRAEIINNFNWTINDGGIWPGGR